MASTSGTGDDIRIGEVVGHDVTIPGRVAFVQDASKLSPRAGHVAVALDNLMLVWGGYCVGSGMHYRERFLNASELYVYHAEIEKWFIFKITTGAVPSQCSGATGVVVGSVLYIFGGFYGCMDTFRTWRNAWTMHSLDLKTMKWSTDMKDRENRLLDDFIRRNQNGEMEQENQAVIGGEINMGGGDVGEVGNDDQESESDEEEISEEEEEVEIIGDDANQWIDQNPALWRDNGWAAGIIRRRIRAAAAGERQNVGDDGGGGGDASTSSSNETDSSTGRERTSSADKNWSKSVPTPRHKFVGWEHCGKLYYFGGFGTPPEQMPVQFQDFFHYRFLAIHGTFVLDDQLNYDSAWNNQMVVYDLATGLWSNPKCLKQVPCPRAAHVAVKISGNRLVLFGGRYRTRRLADLYVMDCETLEWTCLSSDLSIADPLAGSIAANRDSLAECLTRPCGRSWSGMCAVDSDQVLMYGGFTSDERPLNDCWLLNTKEWTWKQFQFSPDRPQPKPRLWHTAVSPEEGAAYMFGGCEDNIFDETQIKRFARELLCVRTNPPSLLKLSLSAIIRNNNPSTYRYYKSIFPNRLLALLMLAFQPIEAIRTYQIFDVMTLWNPTERPKMRKGLR